MTNVQGLALSNYWIIGWWFYNWGFGICNYYVTLLSFYMALFFQDWMLAETQATKMCYDFFTPFY